MAIITTRQSVYLMLTLCCLLFIMTILFISYCVWKRKYKQRIKKNTKEENKKKKEEKKETEKFLINSDRERDLNISIEVNIVIEKKNENDHKSPVLVLNENQNRAKENHYPPSQDLDTPKLEEDVSSVNKFIEKDKL